VVGRRLLAVLGNQLFPPDRLQHCRDAVVFMAEDIGLRTYVRHHQQKIVLFLAAMRSYADELRDTGFEVRYFPLDPDRDWSYEEKLERAVAELECRELLHFEVEDKPMETCLVDSSEWVMGPNVYGMGIFRDGGVFATKPYIFGSNYIRKMSDYGKGDWRAIVDGLFSTSSPAKIRPETITHIPETLSHPRLGNFSRVVSTP
jgi:deoxyribodipyrimidine photolyase-like uncharacterized protein